MKQGNAVLCAALVLCAAAAGHGQASAQLASSSKLEQDWHRKDSWTYRNPNAAIRRYKAFMIRPTAIYADPTSEWDGASQEKRRKYANELTKALQEEIGNSYSISAVPGPDVAVMQLTLLGVEGTKTGIATASRATPIGLALNSVKSIAGKPGSFTGSVQVAFELKDSRTQELQFAAVRRRSPDALDIPATLSTEATVEAVARDVANSIRKGLDKANGR